MIVEQLKNGADFAQIAKDKSINSAAADGGYIGEIDPTSLRAELRNAIAGARPGSFTGAMRTPEGYAIVQVLDKPPSKDGNDVDPINVLPFAARGTVRFTSDVSGYGESLLARQSYLRMIPGWEQDLHAGCEAALKGVPLAIERVREMIAEPGAQAEDKTLQLYTLGQLLASDGNMSEAIRQWELAYSSAVANQLPVTRRLQVVLGTAYLHRASWGEQSAENGIDRSHIFPSMPGALHPNMADLHKAIEYFLDVLHQEPSNQEVRWMLNVAYMTAGTYPDKVPPEFLISPDKFASKEDLGRFVDVAPAAGINIPTMAGGIIVDDFDNDGLLDIVVSQIDDCAPLHFFHNNGNGTFVDRSKQAGLTNQLGGLNIIQADYNNDGCIDILVLRGGWEFSRRLSLLRNNCDGTFTDVTTESGLGHTPTSTQSAVWTDIDNDGNLDLFIANENSPAQLFLNKGDGTFVDISHGAGIDRTAFSKAAVAGDYDGDGYPDIFVSNFSGDNFLYHNNGDLTFTEVAKRAGVEQPWRSFGAAFLDYDNDGHPDLFVSSYYTSTEEFAKGYIGLPRNAEGMKLYHNHGDGTFADVSAEVGLDRVLMPMGCNFGDIDNDGYLDIYLGNGNPSYAAPVPNVLLHNDGGKAFVDISASSGTGAMEKGHGIAFADFTNSGHEDIAVVMGGAIPGDRHALRLFENPGNTGDWLTVRLVGVKSNRSAIGARIKVTVQDGATAPRNIYRTVGSGASFGASPLEQHIGLGKRAIIRSLEIYWPATRTTQIFQGVSVNQAIEIKEFDHSYRKLVRKQFQFDARKTLDVLHARAN